MRVTVHLKEIISMVPRRKLEVDSKTFKVVMFHRKTELNQTLRLIKVLSPRSHKAFLIPY